MDAIILSLNLLLHFSTNLIEMILTDAEDRKLVHKIVLEKQWFCIFQSNPKTVYLMIPIKTDALLVYLQDSLHHDASGNGG